MNSRRAIPRVSKAPGAFAPYSMLHHLSRRVRRNQTVPGRNLPTIHPTRSQRRKIHLCAWTIMTTSLCSTITMPPKAPVPMNHCEHLLDRWEERRPGMSRTACGDLLWSGSHEIPIEDRFENAASTQPSFCDRQRASLPHWHRRLMEFSTMFAQPEYSENHAESRS
jgi:hypothetical protein